MSDLAFEKLKIVVWANCNFSQNYSLSFEKQNQSCSASCVYIKVSQTAQ